MTDSKISKKPSLSGRVLTIAVLLLVIPLLLQSFFLYNQEYKEKLSDITETLQVIAKERAAFLSEKGPPYDLTPHGEPYPIKFAVVDKPTAQNPDILQVDEPLSGKYLEVSVPKEEILALHQSEYYYRFVTLLIFVGVFGGGCVYLLTRRVSRPLKELCKTMQRVSEGAIHARYTPDWMGFEINALGKQFNETLDSMLKLTAQAELEKIHREKLAEELKIGREIQKGLFPANVKQFKGLEIASRFLPAKELNGDFSDLFHLENGSIVMVICDTAGKGIPACLFSLGLRSMIRSLASTTSDLAEIVVQANNLFWLDARESGMFSTVWIGIYDPKKQNLTYCSQGHPPGLLLRQGKVIELWTGGISLGAQKLETVPTKQIELQGGDLLLLYTDGIIEAHDLNNNLFGKDKLTHFLLSQKEKFPERIADSLLNEVDRFCKGALQHDDLTFISFLVDN